MKLPASILVPTLVVVAGIGLKTSMSVSRNPSVVANRRIEAHVAIPKDVEAILLRSCRDCHSFETRWPWYSRLPLVSGFLQRDVERARAHMNFSDWSAKLAQGDDEVHAALSGMCEELRSDSMPLTQYRWLHRESRLTKGDVEIVCRWTDRITGAPPSPVPSAQTLR
jgi:hypothetical protein